MNTTTTNGVFAEVATGNCTSGYILDGDDVQERANAQYPKSYGAPFSRVYKRGIVGFGIPTKKGFSQFYVFSTLEAAQRELAARAKRANEQ